MATIGLRLEGDIRAFKKAPNNDCLSVYLSMDIDSGGDKVPFARDTVYLHGNEAQIRAFATAILAALPVEVEAA